MAQKVVLFVGLLLCTTGSILADTEREANPSCQYYVSAHRGDDANRGSLTSPFHSLQHALQLIINSTIDAEVSVCVEDGSYSISSLNLTSLW